MTLEELNKQIKSGSFLPLYFFYGEEQYLLKSKLSAMEKKLVTPGTEAFNSFVFEGPKLDIEAILETVDQFPQMSEKKLVVVKNSGFFQNANSREYKRLAEASLDLPDDTCLVFIEDTFDKKKEKNLKFVEEYGGVLEFSYLPINKVELWLEEKFRKAEKMIAPKDISYMVQSCGLSLGKLQIEFDKIINFLGKKNKISRDDLDLIISKTIEYRVYDMIGNIIAGRSEKAREQLKFLQDIQNSPASDTKDAPTDILGYMMGKISELLLCKLLREAGLQAKDMVDYFDFKRPLFAVNKTIEESKRYGEAYLKRMLQKGLHYDSNIKNGLMDGWTAVELYFSELTKQTE